MNTAPLWPRHSFDAVPAVGEAQIVAAAIRQAVGLDERAPLLDLAPVLEAGGFRLREVDLLAARGGREALLFPLNRNRFQVSVDPTPRGGWGLSEAALLARTSRRRVRFRVLHEVAHSFFYDRSEDVPQRMFRFGSTAEESFCDEVAKWTLVPPAALASSRWDPRSILDVAEHYDVSVELASRAFAEAHPYRSFVALLYWRGRLQDHGVRLQWASGNDDAGDLIQAVEARIRAGVHRFSVVVADMTITAISTAATRQVVAVRGCTAAAA